MCLAKGYSELIALPLHWTGLPSWVSPGPSGHLCHRTSSLRRLQGLSPNCQSDKPRHVRAPAQVHTGTSVLPVVTQMLLDCSGRRARQEAVGMRKISVSEKAGSLVLG